MDTGGRLVRFTQQDRSKSDHGAISEAPTLLEEAARPPAPDRFLLQAEIALAYVEATSYDETDWPRILRLYDDLMSAWPSPVVALNRAVVMAMVFGPERALRAVEALEGNPRLAYYHYLPAIKADLLRRRGRDDEARRATEDALGLARNDAEREALRTQSDPVVDGAP